MKTYSTGEICKICNMSRKKLLYYEERGLLDGIIRGEKNNYRYYTEKNINSIIIIKELLNIGFSLNEIVAMSLDSHLESIKMSIKKRMLNAKEELKLSVTRYEQSVEKYTQIEESMWLLKTKSMHEEEQGEPYEIIDFPAQKVVSVSFKGTFLDTEQSYYKELSKVYNIVEEYGIITLGSSLIIYHDHFNSNKCDFDFDYHKIECCLPVTDFNKNCPYYKTIEGFKGVAIKHCGSYDDNFIKTYVDLLKWAKERGYRLANTSYEDYLIGPMLTRNPNSWVTNIIIPILNL